VLEEDPVMLFQIIGMLFKREQPYIVFV
jgi:hypothetical protein